MERQTIFRGVKWWLTKAAQASTSTLSLALEYNQHHIQEQDQPLTD
ncbi:MAG: hypothetical protein ACR2PW_05440 [Gammaproteobacteria bacterium]